MTPVLKGPKVRLTGMEGHWTIRGAVLKTGGTYQDPLKPIPHHHGPLRTPQCCLELPILSGITCTSLPTLLPQPWLSPSVSVGELLIQNY